MNLQAVERWAGSDAVAADAARSVPEPLAATALGAIAELEALAPEWRALEASAAATVFQSADWCLAFLRRNADALGVRPFVVTVRRGRTLAAVLPLMVQREHGLRIARWLGDPLSQYGDVLAAAGDDEAAAAAFAAARRWVRADLMNLRKLRADSALLRVVDLAPFLSGTADAAPFADLSAYSTAEDYWAARRSKFVRNQRRVRRRLEELGPVHFAVAATPQAAVAAVEEAIAFKQAWLEERGLMSRAALIGDPHRLLVDLAASQQPGGLVLSRLTVAGETAAVEAGFAWGGRYYAYLGAFNPRFAQASPGLVQMEETIRWCHARGLARYDLFAPADDYKSQWADSDCAVGDYVVPASALGRLYAAAYLKRLRPVLRRAWAAAPVGMRRRLGALVRRS